MSLEAVIRAVGQSLIDARDELNDLDSAAGDGDLGLTASALGAVLVELAAELAGMTPDAALRHAGMAIGQKAPSTFGTLISMGLISAARGLKDVDTTTLPPTTVVALAGREFLSAIEVRGKAARGDKTMLDAIGPAVESLERSAADGSDVAAALTAAADAARQGADSTRDMEARVGRQAWLSERARGHVDGGAHAVALALRAAADTAVGS